MKKELLVFKSELCVMCGREVPEGRQICTECERDLEERAAENERRSAFPKKKRRKLHKRRKNI